MIVLRNCVSNISRDAHLKRLCLFLFSAHFSFSSQSEIEETLKRIQSHKGVTGVIVVNQEGRLFPLAGVQGGII